ncbi:MAG: hypothetical protein Q9191_004278 [Dirinaria sp. TL-2023a]
MKFHTSALFLLLCGPIVSSLSINSGKYALPRREAEAETEMINTPLIERFDEALLSYLQKRRGGGGGGGGGGRGSSGGSSSSSSGSSGSSSSGSRSGSSGSGSGSRNTGTASSSSSIRPAYGGGKYYGGGATSAYKSGTRSPLGLAPYALVGAGAGLVFPGLWLYGAYAYNFDHPYHYHNASNTTDPRNNETLPVTCLCDKYSACGCDDNGNTTYVDSLLGNGSSSDQNSTLVHVGNVNGTKTVVINGTLPNGTDTSSSSATPSSGALRQSVFEACGFWVVGLVVAATVLT